VERFYAFCRDAFLHRYCTPNFSRLKKQSMNSSFAKWYCRPLLFFFSIMLGCSMAEGNWWGISENIILGIIVGCGFVKFR
jgi:hypothetical protein